MHDDDANADRIINQCKTAALILEDHKKTLATAEEFSLILPQCRFGNYLGKNL